MATTVERNRRDGANMVPARAERPTRSRGAVLNGQRRPIIHARSRTADGSRPLSAGSVVIVGVIVYVLASLLNSAGLVNKAKAEDSSTLPGFTGVAEEIDRVAGWLYLDRPSEWAQELRADDAGAAPAADAEEAFDDLGDATASTVPADGTTATSAPADPNAAAATTTIPTESTVPPGQPVLRVPTDADPLRVYVAGDSLVGGWGAALDQIAGSSTGIDVELDYEVSTGLVRTDYYNWPARLQQKITELDPEVVILGFGGNDKQPIKGKDVLDPDWQAEYRRRVGAVMDYVNQGGRKLIWVGTPTYPDEVENAKFAVMNQIYMEEAAKRSNITYVDTWARFLSPAGGYAPYIANEAGEFVDVRASDGFHLNETGVGILGNLVMTEIQNAVQQYS